MTREDCECRGNNFAESINQEPRFFAPHALTNSRLAAGQSPIHELTFCQQEERVLLPESSRGFSAFLFSFFFLLPPRSVGACRALGRKRSRRERWRLLAASFSVRCVCSAVMIFTADGVSAGKCRRRTASVYLWLERIDRKVVRSVDVVVCLRVVG